MKLEDKFEVFELDFDFELRKGIVVRVGGFVRIYILFKGRLIFDIIWFREEGEFIDKV